VELHDPALVVFFFFPSGDEGSETLWANVSASAPRGRSSARRDRFALDGSTVVQFVLEREGAWEEGTWQDLSQEMTTWLGRFAQSPPGRPWGVSQVFVGAAVTDLYEEQRVLHRQLALPETRTRAATVLPTGRLWLITPPAMTEGRPLTATYAWIYAPSRELRQQLQGQIWQKGAPFQRAELYLHRALHQLRQYGKGQRASLWTAMEQTETAAAKALIAPTDSRLGDALRRACGTVVQGLAQLSRHHNLLRSSGHLYRQIGSDLRQEEGGLFPWFEDRLKEALQQWGYDLERADRAITLCQTALLAARDQSQPTVAPARIQIDPVQVPPQVVSVPARPQWPLYLIAAAVLALCLVDDSWLVVLARVGVLLVLSLLAWFLWRRQGERHGETGS
jgi:hypothetical protein